VDLSYRDPHQKVNHGKNQHATSNIIKLHQLSPTIYKYYTTAGRQSQAWYVKGVSVYGTYQMIVKKKPSNRT
jgi:hypothetical protein